MNPKSSKPETEELPLAKATEMLLSESRMVLPHWRQILAE